MVDFILQLHRISLLEFILYMVDWKYLLRHSGYFERDSRRIWSGGESIAHEHSDISLPAHKKKIRMEDGIDFSSALLDVFRVVASELGTRVAVAHSRKWSCTISASDTVVRIHRNFRRLALDMVVQHLDLLFLLQCKLRNKKNPEMDLHIMHRFYSDANFFCDKCFLYRI